MRLINKRELNQICSNTQCNRLLKPVTLFSVYDFACLKFNSGVKNEYASGNDAKHNNGEGK
jgi:hypothetical protein